MLTYQAASTAIAPRLPISTAAHAVAVEWLRTKQPTSRALNAFSWRVIAEALTKAVMTEFSVPGALALPYLSACRELAAILDRGYMPETEQAALADVAGKWKSKGCDSDVVSAILGIAAMCKRIDLPILKPEPAPEPKK